MTVNLCHYTSSLFSCGLHILSGKSFFATDLFTAGSSFENTVITDIINQHKPLSTKCYNNRNRQIPWSTWSRSGCDLSPWIHTAGQLSTSTIHIWSLRCAYLPMFTHLHTYSKPGRTETATQNGAGQAGSCRHCGSHSSVASSIGPD